MPVVAKEKNRCCARISRAKLSVREQQESATSDVMRLVTLSSVRGPCRYYLFLCPCRFIHIKQKQTKQKTKKQKKTTTKKQENTTTTTTVV